MPFIQRIVEPVFLSRPTQQSTTAAAAAAATTIEQQPSNSAKVTTIVKTTTTKPTYDDFTSITNCTLANILRQLASVVLVADEILSDLGNELQTIRDRSNNIQKRIIGVEKCLETVDSTIIYKVNKKNFIDDNDVSIYKTKRTISTSLFTAATRPPHIQKLYEKAAPTPVLLACNGDTSSENNFSVCPSVGHTRRQITKKIDAEIETRVPAAIEELRKWTSSEAIGEITVAPNCLAKVGTSSLHNSTTIAEESYASFSTSYVDGIDVTSTSTNDNVDGVNDVPLDHKLPSPEEQCKSIAQKYPAEIVPVNTSKVRFERMCSIRKSMGHMPTGKVRYLDEFQATRRSLRARKPSSKRRNTIAGIEDKDIKEAYTQMRHSAVVGTSSSADEKTIQIMPRSKSNDLLRSNGTIDSLRSSNRFANFKALKQWGKHRLKLINRIDENVEGENVIEPNQNDSPKNLKPRAKTAAEKCLKQNPLYSSSEKLFTNLIESDVTNCSSPTHPVKLRTSMTRRQRRNKQYRCEEPNSSSGNWSASSESGRTSASSEVAMHKKSSNSCSSLNQNKPPITNSSALSKRRINTSTSSSITSDDTANHEVPTGYIDLFDDNESMYSCDTEGYFTSFHVDSGLKTLKEEEINIVPAMLSTSALLPIDGSNISSNIGDSLSRTTISVDSDYELFGKGSTSTTASSGTVCTALLGSLSNNSLVEMPVAPERKSSLNSKLMNISNYGKPKLLTNKSDSASKRGIDKEATQTRANLNNLNKDDCAGVTTTVSDMEISENSDFEGVERVKRIKGKTLINTNRIPSICIITPLNSDDEDRVAAMESMLSSLNINQKDLPLSELGEEKTVAQVHSPCAQTRKMVSDENVENENVTTNDEVDGEYVTISDVGSRSHANSIRVSDIVTKDLDQVLADNLNTKTEYVSLSELPCNANFDENLLASGKNVKLISGTNVKFNANGMFVYDSSTLRYKRSLCTTFKGIATTHNSDAPGDSSKTVTSKLQNENLVTEDNRMSTDGSPPFEKMASDHNDSTSLDDVYVTLAADTRELNTSPKSLASVSDSELSDTSRDAKSDTWAVPEKKIDHLKEMKRRFSWENITKSKESSRSKSKRRHRKFMLPLDFNLKKSSPKSKSTFKTSTPKKAETSSKARVNENSFGNNTSISQVTFNKPQTTTCSDRLGVPKTSLNEFKKLLLNATNKKLATKSSAVEQLKLKHDSLNSSPMKILDLSCSPKSFTNRRVFQQQQQQQQTQTLSSSPYKKTNLMSPRSRWKYSNFNKSSIASIPEANIEDDAISLDSNHNENFVEKEKKLNNIEPEENLTKSTIYSTPQKLTSAPVQNENQNDISTSVETPIAQITASVVVPIIAETESSPATGIIETNFSMRDNFFLQFDENNFIREEIKPHGASKLAKKSMLKTITEAPPQQPDEASTNCEPATIQPPTLETSF